MQSGSISFFDLYEYIRQHREIPHKDEQSFAGFRDLYLQLTRHIPDISGWYCWVKIENASSKIIYIGQSKTRKTASLQARLTEEFLDEYVALWVTVWGDEAVTILDQKYHGKYTASIKRSARKAGTTHIVWFGEASLSEQELNVVEHALIAKHNPPANKQSRSYTETFPDLTIKADASLQRELSRLARD